MAVILATFRFPEFSCMPVHRQAGVFLWVCHPGRQSVKVVPGVNLTAERLKSSDAVASIKNSEKACFLNTSF